MKRKYIEETLYDTFELYDENNWYEKQRVNIEKLIDVVMK